MIGAAALLATPELALDDAGSALNDVVSIALAHDRRRPDRRRPPEGRAGYRGGVFVTAALAAGLGLGTKYPLIPSFGTRPSRGLGAPAPRNACGGRVSGQLLSRSPAAIGIAQPGGDREPVTDAEHRRRAVEAPEISFPGVSKVSDYPFDSQAMEHLPVARTSGCVRARVVGRFAVVLVGAAVRPS